MFRATLWLTLATIAGLALGFGREWLLVDAWGAGARTDGFLVALFVPEAIRMTLAAGLLSSAALPLFQRVAAPQQPRWIATQLGSLLLTGVLIALVLSVASTLWVTVIGPGMAPAVRQVAASSLMLLAWTVPLVMVHALAAAVGQAKEHFMLAGLGSFLYNLPAVIVLLLQRSHTQERTLALAFVAGAVLMMLSVLPLLWRAGWRPWQWNWNGSDARALYRKLGPLLVSAGASQGLVLLERICASFLGEGAITVVNLARKLVNLPLVALMSLNQVVLARMTRLAGDAAARRHALQIGLLVTASMTLPAAVGMVGAAPSLVELFLPAGMAQGQLPLLLAWFACVIVFGAWNALLARYAYATGDTVLPMRCELQGSALNAAALLLVPALTGAAGIAWAALAGCLLTAFLFLRSYGLLRAPVIYRLPLVALVALAIAGGVFQMALGQWQQIGVAALLATVCLLVMVAWTVRAVRQGGPAN